MSRSLSNLDIVSLHYILTIVKGLLQRARGILTKALDNQGTINTKLEIALPNI